MKTKISLKLETRKKIYNLILKNPGLHLSELSRRLNIPKSTMYYHLEYLKKWGFLVEKSNGKYIRYYVANEIGEIDKKILTFLRQEVPFEIIMFLFLNPGSSETKINKNLKKRSTTTAFHLNKLMDLDIIEGISIGNGMKYRIKSPEKVSDLIIRYRKSFFR